MHTCLPEFHSLRAYIAECLTKDETGVILKEGASASIWTNYLFGVRTQHPNTNNFNGIIWTVGFEVVTAVVIKSTIFWDITPCSPLKVNRRAFTLVSCSAYSSILTMEAICSSETSVDFQRTTRRYIPEDSTLHNLECFKMLDRRGPGPAGPPTTARYPRWIGKDGFQWDLVITARRVAGPTDYRYELKLWICWIPTRQPKRSGAKTVRTP
jgi:hypothetical protein